jgi:hypothetical protein
MKDKRRLAGSQKLPGLKNDISLTFDNNVNFPLSTIEKIFSETGTFSPVPIRFL